MVVHPLLPLEVTTPSQKYKYIYIGRCHPYARKFAIKAILSSVQLTLRATRPTHYGATRLVQVMSAWSVKTDVLRPGIVGMRRSMVIPLLP